MLVRPNCNRESRTRSTYSPGDNQSSLLTCNQCQSDASEEGLLGWNQNCGCITSIFPTSVEMKRTAKPLLFLFCLYFNIGEKRDLLNKGNPCHLFWQT